MGPSHPLQPPPPYLIRAQRRRGARGRSLVFLLWRGASYPRSHRTEPAPLRSLSIILIAAAAATIIRHGNSMELCGNLERESTTNRLGCTLCWLALLHKVRCRCCGKQRACVQSYWTYSAASPSLQREKKPACTQTSNWRFSSGIRGVQMSSDLIRQFRRMFFCSLCRRPACLRQSQLREHCTPCFAVGRAAAPSQQLQILCTRRP